MELTDVLDDPALELAGVVGFVAGPGGAALGDVLITPAVRDWIAEGAELAAQWAKTGNPSPNPDAAWLAYALDEHSRGCAGRKVWVTRVGSLIVFTAPTEQGTVGTIADRRGGALHDLVAAVGLQPDGK